MTSTRSPSTNTKTRSATRRIESFRQRFGDGHFYLACHAALPLALTPDLLYSLWANFQRDIHGEAIEIPWIAVADLMLSNLCKEVGNELYEMDQAVRDDLLNQLQNDPRFRLERLQALADFVMAYVEQQLDSPDLDARDLAQAQKWRALAYKSPAAAAHELALALARLNLADKTEWIRTAELITTLAEPLAGFSSFLTYASAMKDFARGNKDSATTKFSQILNSTHSVQIAGVALLVPEDIEINQPRSKLNSASSEISRINYLQRYFLWHITSFSLGISLTIAYYLHQHSFSADDVRDTPISVPSISPTPQPTETAKPDSQTDTVLRLGSTGPDVAKLQQRLGIPVNGVFGPSTDRAVIIFQASNNLVADGIVGLATRNALYNGNSTNAISPNPTYPPVNSSASSARKQYVVLVPAKSSATLSQVQAVVPGAVYSASNLGKYIWAGAFDERSFAESRAALLRANKLDAQVRYF